MSFLSWLLVGFGVFMLYSAVKGSNPLTSLASHLGVKATGSKKLGAA